MFIPYRLIIWAGIILAICGFTFYQYEIGGDLYFTDDPKSIPKAAENVQERDTADLDVKMTIVQPEGWKLHRHAWEQMNTEEGLTVSDEEGTLTIRS